MIDCASSRLKPNNAPAANPDSGFFLHRRLRNLEFFFRSCCFWSLIVLRRGLLPAFQLAPVWGPPPPKPAGSVAVPEERNLAFPSGNATGFAHAPAGPARGGRCPGAARRISANRPARIDASLASPAQVNGQFRVVVAGSRYTCASASSRTSFSRKTITGSRDVFSLVDHSIRCRR